MKVHQIMFSPTGGTRRVSEILCSGMDKDTAINEFTHTGLIAEIKRNVHKLSMSKLQEKIATIAPKTL